MASLSQALRLGDLPPPHRTFQGHATHIIEWSMMLRPNDSWSTCILQGIATFLHYASRRSAGYRYIYGPTRAVKEVSSEKNTLRDRCRHIAVYGFLPTCKLKSDDERQRATCVYATSRGGATPWS